MKTDCVKYKGCAVKDTNHFCPNNCSEYDKKIQMTELQARQMIDICGWNPDAIADLKKHGYIKRTALEFAEDLYKEYANKRIHSGRFEIVEVQHEAIQELKKQIEEMKK